MLYECNVPKVPLKSEVKYIKNYIALEKLRQSKDFNISFDIQGTIDNQYITPLLFTPFLENAFKHGINKVLGNRHIKILLKVDGDDLYFSVENSKPQVDIKDIKKNQGGIGLANVKKRLKLLYPDKHKLEIENTTTTYKIELFLTLK